MSSFTILTCTLRLMRSFACALFDGLRQPVVYVVGHAVNFVRDRRLGVRAYGAAPGGEYAGANKDGWSYQPISYRRLDLIFQNVPTRADDVFMDMGCGLGRAVFRAAQEPIKKSVGVEIDPVLADLARQNAARLRTRRADVEIICADATRVPVDDVTLLFLFHPFRWKSMLQVLDRLQASLLTNPRPLHIIYAYAAEHAVLLDMCDWLEPGVKLDGGYIRIWKARGTNEKQ